MLKSTTMLLATIGWVAALGGCTVCPIQRNANTPPEPVDETPLIVDGAMQIRDWDRSVAYYANGDTIAYPTGFNYQPHWYQPEPYYYFIETPLFITQSILSPIAFIFTPPWMEMRNTGVTVAPTYTAMPVLPPSMATATEAPAEPVPVPEHPEAPVEMSSPVTPATQPS